ncbi:AraC family transcriptional regulator [Paenibacillus sp. y28]|uniref:AraC family transcriptional regulator n=1 Tax=Paenibacillus sp. y28 TaxID=3129110 RepID=UPI00301B0E6E
MPKYMLRLLAFSFLIGAIPVITLGIFSYYIATGDVEQKVKEGNQQLLLQTQMRMEQTLKTLELTSIQYINSPQVTSAINENLESIQYDKIRDLSMGLYNLQTFAGISDGYLIGLEKEWVVSFTSFKKFAEFEKKSLIEQYAKHPTSLFWDTNPVAADNSNQVDPEGNTTPAASQATVNMVYKLPIVPITAQPRGFLVIEILKSQLLTQLTGSRDLGSIYVINREGQHFLAYDTESDAKASYYESLNQKIAQMVQATGKENGFFNTDIGQEEVGVAYRASSYNGWIYVSVVSIHDLTKGTRKIAMATIVACSIIFVVIGLLAFFLSRKMYSPIKRLFEFTKDVNAGETNTKDEFVSIEQRFKTLFSTGQQLEQQVQGQFVQLKEFFVLKLLTGQISESDFTYRSTNYGFPLEWQNLGLLTLQIDTLQGTRYRDHDRELLLFAINNMVGELIPAHQRFSPVLLDQSQVTLITSDLEQGAELKEQFHQTAELILSKVQEFLQISVSIGISSPFKKVTGSVHAYREGLESLKSRLNLGNNIILHYEDVQARNKELEATVYTQLKWTEDQLISAIKLGDAAKVHEWFDKYIADLVEKNVNTGEYPVLMMQLVSKLYQVVQEQGGNVKKVLGERATYDRLLKLSTLNDIIAWFKSDLFEPIMAFLNEQAESQYINIANQMVKLVHERYDQDISLESCASKLNFHPVYLSRVFKKEMGINFSEYLADYRMNIAKTWLETTSLKISEIAERLNYTNTTAFIRTFRKIVGMTPGQYREHNKKE